MKKKLSSFFLHLIVFILVEILFVFLILQELPSINIFETIGIIHISYWILLLVAGFLREKVTKIRQKFLCTYVPVLLHVAGHLYVGMETIEHIYNHGHEEQNTLRLSIATISVGVLIFVGEWLLHRATHCDTHHQSVHKNCKHE